MSAKIGVWGGAKDLLQWGLSPRVLEIPSHSLSTCIHIHLTALPVVIHMEKPS